MAAEANDWYAILGVARDASAADVRAAHRRLARNLHPDVSPDPEAHRLMSLVNRARDVLLDPAGRAAFDRSGGSQGGAAAPAPRPYAAAPPDPRDWYEFIGVEPGSDPSELIAALRWKRDWIRAQHFSDEDYTRQSLFWRDASETLTSPRSRASYDRARHLAFGSDRDLPPDWYAFLGVRRDADTREIAERVTELSRHPLQGKQFQRDLENAWRTLGDAESRAEYDATIGAGTPQG